MTALAELMVWTETTGRALLWGGLLCFFRVGACLALLPVFGEQVVPVRFRLGLALALTVAVAPAIPAPPDVTPSAILAEATTGLALGAVFRTLTMALQIAGAIAAQATSLSQIFASAGAEPQSAFSTVLLLAGLAMLCSAGFHVQVIVFLIRSHDLVAQGQFLPAAAVSAWGVSQIAGFFGLGFALAAPFLIGGLVYNIALGAINRAMPALMVVFIGAPALTAGGMILLALAAPMMLAAWLQQGLIWLGAPFDFPR